MTVQDSKKLKQKAVPWKATNSLESYQTEIINTMSFSREDSDLTSYKIEKLRVCTIFSLLLPASRCEFCVFFNSTLSVCVLSILF